MQNLTRFIPPVLWLGAAALVFPAFAPNGYNALLFGGRLAGAALCLVLAYVAFRTPHWFKPQLAVGLAGLVAANYVSNSGFNLIPPSENHLRTLVEEGLSVQGPEAVAEYTDLGISGMTCVDWHHAWECDFGLSYKNTSTNTVHDNERMHIRYDKGTGERFEMAAAKGCELDFQWSRRLRASSYHTPGMEPVSWLNCDGSRDNDANYVRTLDAQGRYGLTFALSKTDKAARLTLEPLPLGYAEIMVKEHYDAGLGDSVACDYAPSKPFEIHCTFSGTRPIWSGNVASISNPLGINRSQVRRAVEETVKIIPSGKKWKIVK